jgi:hypothetical protein
MMVSAYALRLRLTLATVAADHGGELEAAIEVLGHQPKAEWNGHYNARISHPLITSIAETGDMLDARLRAGNVGTADGARSMSSSTLWTARRRASATWRWCASMRGFLRPHFWPGLRRAASNTSLGCGPTPYSTGWPSLA